MPHPRWPRTALGLAFLGVAGIGLWLRSGSAVDAPGSGAPAATTTDHLQRPLQPPAPGTGRWTAEAEGGPAHTAAESPGAPAPLLRHAAPSPATAAPALTEEAVWAHYQPSPEELAYRAHKVEQEANAELRNLLHVLELDEAQQDRVFAALARASTYFHPALQPQGAGGTPIGTGGPPASAPEASPVPAPSEEGAGSTVSPSPAAPTDPVLAELTPEQADVYERYTSERDAFWAGVVEDIEREINAAP